MTFDNMRTVSIHKNTVLIEPDFLLFEAVERLTDALETRTCQRVQYFELGGGEGKSPYRQALGDIDHTIGQLKRARREMQRLAQHTHQWDANDYCSICGADGRA